MEIKDRKNIFVWNRIKLVLVNNKNVTIFVDGFCQSKNIHISFYEKFNKEIYEEIEKLDKTPVWQNIWDVFELLQVFINRQNFDKWLQLDWEFVDSVLDDNMKNLYGFLEEFKEVAYLVWWTAFSLQKWHRESIDYDIFMNWEFVNKEKIEFLMQKHNLKKDSNFKNEFKDESCFFNFWINGVAITFNDFSKPYLNLKEFWWIDLKNNRIFIDSFVKVWNFPLLMPNLKTLGAMKLFAMVQRHKNKDFYDLVVTLEDFSIEEIYQQAIELFWDFLDINKILEKLKRFDFKINEKIVWLNNKEVSEKEMREKILKARKDLIIYIEKVQWRKRANFLQKLLFKMEFQY